MLKDAYHKHLNDRRPVSVRKFDLDTVFEERLLEITDERVIDLVQLLAYEVLTLRDLNGLMSERLLSLKPSNTASSGLAETSAENDRIENELSELGHPSRRPANR